MSLESASGCGPYLLTQEASPPPRTEQSIRYVSTAWLTHDDMAKSLYSKSKHKKTERNPCPTHQSIFPTSFDGQKARQKIKQPKKSKKPEIARNATVDTRKNVGLSAACTIKVDLDRASPVPVSIPSRDIPAMQQAREMKRTPTKSAVERPLFLIQA